MALERFSAAWREGYVTSAFNREFDHDDDECVFCVLGAEPVSESTGVLKKSEYELHRPQRLSLRVGPSARRAVSPRRGPR